MLCELLDGPSPNGTCEVPPSSHHDSQDLYPALNNVLDSNIELRARLTRHLNEHGDLDTIDIPQEDLDEMKREH